MYKNHKKLSILFCVLLLVAMCAGIYFNNIERYDVVDKKKESTVSTLTKEVSKNTKEIVDEAKKETEKVEEKVEEVVEEVVVEEPVYYEENYYEPTYYENGSGLNPTSGVNYHNGWRETYYSSNVLYHYRTPEWTVGADGVYRDADGYVIVASSSDAQGAVVDTSFGAGKVYDTGCAQGTHDIYTNW